MAKEVKPVRNASHMIERRITQCLIMHSVYWMA